MRMQDRFRYRVWDKTQNKWLHFDFSTYPTYQDRIWQDLTDTEYKQIKEILEQWKE